ncbi:MAG: IS1595 family transposase [Novosphingobium sp.]|nr:IS1595 family transposase [Novosphingobium sp.]
MAKSTDLNTFNERFPTNLSIVEHIARVRFGAHVPCPRCRSKAHMFLRTARRVMSCSRCSLEVGILSGTLFDHTRIPLRTWFYLMLTMSNSTRALPVSFVARHFGLSRMAAFGMLSRVRLHLEALLSGRILGGGGQNIQMDETWVGQVKNPDNATGSGAIVFGIYSKSGVLTKVIPNRSQSTLMREVLAHTHLDSVFVTDQLRSYNFLGRLGLKHVRLNHAKAEWVNQDGYSSIGIEGYWANLKYFLQSANLAPTISYFSGYLAEHAFRYNCRKVGLCPFQEMV